jgi:hypothetical protein
MATSRRAPIAMLLFLRRAAGDREAAERIGALVLLLLWAELAAAGGRNDTRPPWMRTASPGRAMRSLRRARRSTSGRRPRG